ncbi:MAG TPA: NUDIX domain-containing protein [Bacteroides sp.]|nr:NUDIX domain-containing protein [Bacteroides sp.]
MAVITELLAPGSVGDRKLTYVVIGARYRDRWLFVRHRERITWEMPAGHIEPGETPGEAAERELREETGAVDFTLVHLSDYSVTPGRKTEFGRLYAADIEMLEDHLAFETEEVRLTDSLPAALTYREVQTVLFNRVADYFQL